MKRLPDVPWEARIAAELNDEKNEAAIPFFLSALRENMRDGQASLRRIILTQVLFGLLFFIVYRAKTADVSILGFKTTDPSLLAKLLPVVVAYLAYDAAFTLALVGRYRLTLSRSLPALSAGLGNVNAHRLVYPPTPAVLGESFYFGPERRPRRWRDIPIGTRVFDAFGLFGRDVIQLATFAFLIYAYASLLGTYGVLDAVTLASLAVSGSFVARIVLLPSVVYAAANQVPEADYPPLG
jgi:hypothetical protein